LLHAIRTVGEQNTARQCLVLYAPRGQTIQLATRRSTRLRPGAIRAWIRAAKLPAQRAGKRVLVRPADLVALLEPILPGDGYADEDFYDDDR